MKILKQQEIFEKKETRYQSGLQNFVGKTGRTVSANEIEIQYVIIISRPLLTYLLTGTDRLQRAIVKEMNYRLVYTVIKGIKSSSRHKKNDREVTSWIRNSRGQSYHPVISEFRPESLHLRRRTFFCRFALCTPRTRY